jgi:hypothetical protein
MGILDLKINVKNILIKVLFNIFKILFNYNNLIKMLKFLKCVHSNRKNFLNKIIKHSILNPIHLKKYPKNNIKNNNKYRNL